jgi:hypothetical protein
MGAGLWQRITMNAWLKQRYFGTESIAGQDGPAKWSADAVPTHEFLARNTED